jgi:hypothetical protein
MAETYETAPAGDSAATVKDDEALDKLHERILREFEDAFDCSMAERTRAEQCRDYYDSFQWTEEELGVLRKRKQPVVTANRIKPKIDSLIGFEKRQRTDPKAYPRTPKHEKDAESATDALRFVADSNAFPKIRSNVAENVFIEGIGAACVGAKRKPDGTWMVTIRGVPWDRFYRDPHSRDRDFCDASFMGEVIWMDDAKAKAEYKEKATEIDGSYDTGTVGTETYDDRPRLTWCDSQRKRIRVLKHRWYDPDKGWQIAVLCRGGFLWGPSASPYLDEEGEPANDLIAVSAYVTRENERYGVVYQHLSIQDEINKRRSKALHRLSMRQVIAEHGAVADVRKAKAEMAKPDGWVEVNKGFEFDVQDGMAQMQGEMALLAEAKGEIDTSGVNPSLQGDLKAPSGRAQELQQGAALSEYSVVFDALKDWSWRVYKASWCRIRQYWTGPVWIRVTDDEQNMRWVAMNKPVTAAEAVQKAMAEGQPVPPELMMQAQAAPESVVGVENPAQTDVDIIVEDGPDTVTVQGEQFQALVDLKKADPAAIPTEMVIEASSLRNKERLLEHAKGGGIPPQVQQQMQELQKKLQAAEQKLAQAGLSAESQKTEQFKAETDRFEAVTGRIEAENERVQALRPEPVGFAPLQ